MYPSVLLCDPSSSSSSSSSSCYRHSLILLTLLTFLSPCTATSSMTSLQLVSPPAGRPLALYHAPSSYHHQLGRPALNSVIITARPDTAQSSSSSSSSSSWRRNTDVATTPQSMSIPQVTIDCVHGETCSETIAVAEATDKPASKRYSQEIVDKFLRDFAKVTTNDEDADRQSSYYVVDGNHHHHHHHHHRNDSEDEASNRLADLYLDDGLQAEESEGQSRWSLIRAQHHNHPYDDKDGWVSLEPIPWSTSKVSKWQSTSSRPHTSGWPYHDHHHHHAVSHDHDDDDVNHSDDDDDHDDDHGKPHASYLTRPNKRPPPPHVRPSLSNYPDIITDGQPGRWPNHQNYRPWQSSSEEDHHRPASVHYDYTRRRPAHSEDHSEGQWVLLSSTKGYALPRRQHRVYQRAITINPPSHGISSSKRTVRLTVLPALNGTTNTTISHGGLLEVESTFHSVEQEHLQKQQQEQLLSANNNNNNNNTRRAAGVRVLAQAQAQAQASRSRAALAAVGAGMLPATMAVLVPMLLGRRRRRRHASASPWRRHLPDDDDAASSPRKRDSHNDDDGGGRHRADAPSGGGNNSSGADKTRATKAVFRNNNGAPSKAPSTMAQWKGNNRAPSKTSSTMPPQWKGNNRSPSKTSATMAPQWKGNNRAPSKTSRTMLPQRKGNNGSPTMPPQRKGNNGSPTMLPQRKGNNGSPTMLPQWKGNNGSPTMLPQRKGNNNAPKKTTAALKRPRTRIQSNIRQPHKATSPRQRNNPSAPEGPRGSPQTFPRGKGKHTTNRTQRHNPKKAFNPTGKTLRKL